MHQLMARTLDTIIGEIRSIQTAARAGQSTTRPIWPMIILRTPKGWTGPKVVDGKPVEGTWRAHQVPVTDFASKPGHVKILEDWMKSYKPEELFDKHGKLISELAELAPTGERRMGANPHANGGTASPRSRHAGFSGLCGQSDKTRNRDRRIDSGPWKSLARRYETERRRQKFPRLGAR